MKTLLIYAVVVALIIPHNFVRAAGYDELNGLSLAPKLDGQFGYSINSLMSEASSEDGESSGRQRAHELNKLGHMKIPQVFALDSTFDRSVLKTSSIQNYTDENGKNNPVKIESISIDGVLTAKEKLKFLKILEEEDKTLEDVREGRVDIILYFPEDIERARAAKTMREEFGKHVILIEVTQTMAQYFNDIAQEATRGYFSRAAKGFGSAVKNSTVFVQDALHSALTANLQGEFKKYVKTVAVQPTKKDDHLAMIFTGINTGFTSAVFIGLNMDHAAFTGFLSLSILTTLVLSRYWRTVNNIFKTDIHNPFKYASAWRQVFARVGVIGTSTSMAQFQMGAQLGALQYLPTQEVAIGNVASIGVGDAYFATKRNKVLSPEAAATISLYTYVLMALPARAIAQYAKEINFSNILAHGGQTIDLLWHPLRDWRLDGGFIEFTGVSLFIMGSYVILSHVLKKKAIAAEQIAQEGFLRYLLGKLDRKVDTTKTYDLKGDKLRTRENLLANLAALGKRNAGPLTCKKYFK